MRHCQLQNLSPTCTLAQELRAALTAIRCFNVETGLIGENTKETGLLPIRMQWWRDAVNSVFRDKPVKHPVIQALAQVNQQALHTCVPESMLYPPRITCDISLRMMYHIRQLQVQAVHPLTRYRLQRLISTREEDLVGMHKMGSIAALEKYAEGTSSQLLYLQVDKNLVSVNTLQGHAHHSCISTYLDLNLEIRRRLTAPCMQQENKT